MEAITNSYLPDTHTPTNTCMSVHVCTCNIIIIIHNNMTLYTVYIAINYNGENQQLVTGMYITSHGIHKHMPKTVNLLL